MLENLEGKRKRITFAADLENKMFNTLKFKSYEGKFNQRCRPEEGRKD